MKSAYLLVFSNCLLTLSLFSQDTIIPRLEIPHYSVLEQIITHTAYTLSYNEEHEQANWVAYPLTGAHTIAEFERTDRFLEDPLVKTESAYDADYKGYGYDRGHLAPAGDMGWSEVTMMESFYYSNMSPQEPSFNRGIWKRLEELVRTWAVNDSLIYVVTGPVLNGKLSSIGIDHVSVPKYYYKVILDYTKPDVKGMGFILPNKASYETLQSFAVSIDSVEKLTGIDFYPSLPNEDENKIESAVNISSWVWNNTPSPTINDMGVPMSSVQCSAITKTGARCKRMTTDPSGRCYQHQ